MHKRFRKMREDRAGGDSGFTLIELLVVVVIIGVLVAIAVPLYLNYRKGAENKSAQSDVRGAISAVEQYYTENANIYPATKLGTVGANVVFAGGTPETATVSSGDTLSYKLGTGGSTYIICGTNADGGNVYQYNSSTGGSVAKAPAAVTTLVLCIAQLP